MNNNFN